MNPAQSNALVFASLWIGMTMAALPVRSQSAIESKPAEFERITVEELKEKIARRTPLAIIDVRTADDYTRSDSKIKGAIFVRSRRLAYRLSQPPLKDVPRDIEVVTYCSCPDEGTSGRAAQTLLGAGFKKVRALKGGWRSWLAAGGQVESKPKGQN